MNKDLKLEVLVAAIEQTDLSLYEKMNLKCDCVIANQCSTWGYQQCTVGNAEVRMINSATRGVGINRNIGLSVAKGDILLFADDDVRYDDGSLQAVVKAFADHPDADVIAFGITMTRGGNVEKVVAEPDCRRYLWNSMRFGACRIAVRRDSVRKYNLRFSELFGGGCLYGSGEDTIFVRECFRKGLRVYSSSYVLGSCARDHSTWFRGYSAKFYYDRGAMLACAFPKGKHIVKWYFAWKLRKKTGDPIAGIIRMMNAGMKGFQKNIPYSREDHLLQEKEEGKW